MDKELKSKINKEAKKDANMKNLQTIAGVGPVVAYAYAAHAGDGSRFSSGSQVSNYLGFVPRLDYSGETQRQEAYHEAGERVPARPAGTGGVGGRALQTRRGRAGEVFV